MPPEITDNHGKFLARCLLTGNVEFLNPNDLAYVFTANAAHEFIDADLLRKHEFHRNSVYVRTEKGLYVLEKFVHLKDVLAVLPDDYFSGNRGVVIDARARRYLKKASFVGLLMRDTKLQQTVEWIKLSRSGQRESDRRQFRPPTSR